MFKDKGDYCLLIFILEFRVLKEINKIQNEIIGRKKVLYDICEVKKKYFIVYLYMK